MKKTILAMCVLLFVGASKGAIIHVDGFKELGDFSTSQTLQMNVGTNLQVMDVDGTVLSLADAGYTAGYWHLALVDAEGYVIGYAKNSGKQIPGMGGRLMGDYSYLLGEGNKPAWAFLVYDSTGNGFHINADTGIIGIAQDWLDGDLFFDASSIYFNGVLGDLSSFPPYLTPGYIPEMVVLIPEPATLALLGIGGLMLRRKK